jgi:EAL domain-containing protein (putative c-di-GMP-specific phosphodiesterase class I)
MGRERALISGTLAAMRTDASPEETAQLICQQVVSLTGIAAAVIMRFGGDGRAHAMGAAVASGGPLELRIIPHQRSRYLREAATRGPWIEAWVNRPWHPYNKLIAKLGITSNAYAPIEHDGVLFGLLTVSSSEAASPLTESLPAIAEFAGLAGAMIGPRLVTSEALKAARAEIEAIIRERAFRPVFQPIVDLVTGRTIGFEALTRFDDGVAPDLRFAEAASLGLGLELEIATLRAALQASTTLSPREVLNLNVSPALVLEGKALRALLRGLPHRLVLEITEHSVIDDYEGFHRAVRAIGPRIRLAVDDAGAGFASFRHILELHPAFVKLDRSMVVGIDADPAKQALVAGMCQFARSTRSRLIAEGVETDAERDTLKRLGVRLAQGFLLGRPGVFRV